ncbi:hypothetical protein JCM9279_005780 [Rhodotorula babjevae]
MQRQAFATGPAPPPPTPDLPTLLAALSSPRDGAALISAVVACAPSATAAAQRLRQATQSLIATLSASTTSLAALQSAAFDRLEVAKRDGDGAAEVEWRALLGEIDEARDATAGTLSTTTLRRNAASRRSIRTALGLDHDAVVYTASAALPVQRDTWAGIASLAALCEQRIAREALPYRVGDLYRESIHAVDRRAGARWGTAAVRPEETSTSATLAGPAAGGASGGGSGGAGGGGSEQRDPGSGSAEQDGDEGPEGDGHRRLDPEHEQVSEAGGEPGEVARRGRPQRAAAAKRAAPPTPDPPPMSRKKRGRPFKVLEPATSSTSSARAAGGAAGRGRGTLLGALSLLGVVHVDLDVLAALPAALDRLAPELRHGNAQLATPPPEGRPEPALAAFARALSPESEEGEGEAPPRPRRARRGEAPGVERLAQLLQGVGLGTT